MAICVGAAQTWGGFLVRVTPVGLPSRLMMGSRPAPTIASNAASSRV